MSMNSLTLSGMDEWVDFDVAFFAIGNALGLFPETYQDAGDAKALLWSNNPVNESLNAIATELVRIGYLEYDREGAKYRLNRAFRVDVAAWPHNEKK